MLLLRADDGVLRWMAGIDGREEAIRTWVYSLDKAWLDGLVNDSPMIKFIGKYSRSLDVQPIQHLLRRENNIQRLLLHAFAPVSDAGCGLDLATCTIEYELAD